MTLREAFGAIEGRVLAYVGDGNNVARSLAVVGALAGRRGARRRAGRLPARRTPARELTDDPAEAVAGADAVYTDVWVSMSDDESEAAAPPRGARARTGSTTRCSTTPRRTRSPCTACPPTRARRSPRASSTAIASGSGTRPRTAGTRRRRCSSCSFQPAAEEVGRTSPPVATRAPSSAAALNPLDVVVLTRERLQEVLDDAVARGRMTRDDARDLLARARRGRAIDRCRRDAAMRAPIAAAIDRRAWAGPRSRSPATTT